MTNPYNPQRPYPQQPYPQQPYAPQPYAPQPYAPQPYAQPGYAQPGYPPQPYPQPGYPPQGYPQQPYPQQPYPQQGYPPQPGYPPAQPGQYAPGQYAPGQYAAPQQGGGQPIVIPIEGRGVAKLAAKMNKRQLVIAPDSLAHEGKQGGFTLPWNEFRQVTVTTAYHQDTTKLVAPKIYRVRLVMDMADPNFPQRHPEISGLQGKYGATGPGSYGMPLGPVNNIVAQLAAALSQYGGSVFGGVIEEGQVIGFSYL